MADYAIMKTQDSIRVADAAALDSAVKAICPKVAGISVVHYTTPQVVILHCSEELESEELDALSAAVVSFVPS